MPGLSYLANTANPCPLVRRSEPVASMASAFRLLKFGMLFVVMLRRFNDRLLEMMCAHPWVTILILLVFICVTELAG
jgi:hypothetical protein